MRRKVFSSFILPVMLLQGISCKESRDAIPQEIIQPDSMVIVLSELHLLEARLLVSANHHLTASDKSAFLGDMLLRTGIDTARFSKSFDYYANHPEIFSDIYEKVVTEISRRQAENK